MEDIGISRMFIVLQILLVIIFIGIIIITIIKTKHEIKNTWIFKIMLMVELLAILLIINMTIFDITMIYHIGAVSAVVMMITVSHLLKKDPGQIIELSQNKIK